jgi:hypothetical protein
MFFSFLKHHLAILLKSLSNLFSFIESFIESLFPAGTTTIDSTKTNDNMSLYQFDTLSSCYGQGGRPGLDSSNNGINGPLGSGLAAADYYSSQAYANSYAAVTSGTASSSSSSSSYPGYLTQNGDHHAHHSHLSSHHTHHSGMNAYSAQNSQTSSHAGSSSGSSTSIVQSSPSFPHQTQYRDYSPPESVPSSHPDNGLVSSLSDCAVMTSLPGSTPGTTTVSPTPVSPQLTYLEPSRRNQVAWNGGVSLTPFGTPDVASMTSSFSDISCSQLNGSPYHHYSPHHLASQLHHPHHHHPHHHSHLHHGRSGNGAPSAPVVVHKWMQIKRNVPKPGKNSSSVLSSHHYSPVLTLEDKQIIVFVIVKIVSICRRNKCLFESQCVIPSIG